MMQRWFFVLLASFSLTGCVSAKKYNDLEKNHNELSEKSKANESKLLEQQAWIAQLESKLGRNTKDKAALEASLTQTKLALEEMAKRRAEAEKRIAEFRDLTSRFKSLVDAGRLSVKIVDGRMVLALSTDILFGSGSANLSNEGRTAISEVAKTLATIPNRMYQVEGHTDNIPIRTAVFPSNWELASARALTVVKAMTDSGVNPMHISAASFGEHKPARENDSKEGRAANRRIEIAIVPDLSTLPGFEELQKISEPKATM